MNNATFLHRRGIRAIPESEFCGLSSSHEPFFGLSLCLLLFLELLFQVDSNTEIYLSTIFFHGNKL